MRCPRKMFDCITTRSSEGRSIINTILAVGSTSLKYNIFSGQVLLMTFHMGTSNQKHFFEFEHFSRFAGQNIKIVIFCLKC